MRLQHARRLPYRNELLQPVVESRRLQCVQDQLLAHRRKCTCHRGHLDMGHDRRPLSAVLLADHELAIRDDFVQHPPLHLDDTEVGTSLCILHLLRWFCYYTRTHRKRIIADCEYMLLIVTNSCVQAWATKLNAGDPNLRQLLVAVSNVVSYAWVLWVPCMVDLHY
jgi:hypothetical protein